MFGVEAFMVLIERCGQAWGQQGIAPGFKGFVQACDDFRLLGEKISINIFAVRLGNIEEQLHAVAEANEFPGEFLHGGLRAPSPEESFMGCVLILA